MEFCTELRTLPNGVTNQWSPHERINVWRNDFMITCKQLPMDLTSVKPTRLLPWYLTEMACWWRNHNRCYAIGRVSNIANPTRSRWRNIFKFHSWSDYLQGVGWPNDLDWSFEGFLVPRGTPVERAFLTPKNWVKYFILKRSLSRNREMLNHLLINKNGANINWKHAVIPCCVRYLELIVYRMHSN